MSKKIILNNDQLSISLDRLACQLTENHDDFKDTVLVGLQPRGKFLCENLVKILNSKYAVNSIDHGYLDITFFRDDFRRNKDVLIPNKTDFKLLVENKKVMNKKMQDDKLSSKNTIGDANEQLQELKDKMDGK